MATTTHRGARDDMTAGQVIALVLGAAFTLAGIAGFIVTGFDHFASRSGDTLLGLEVNPLHNLVHLALGIAGLVMWRRRETARAYGLLTVVGYGAVFVYGLFVADKDSGNILSLNSADNVFHLVVAVAGLLAAFLAVPSGERRTATSSAAR